MHETLDVFTLVGDDVSPVKTPDTEQKHEVMK